MRVAIARQTTAKNPRRRNAPINHAQINHAKEYAGAPFSRIRFRSTILIERSFFL
jgi:hypothetical protein